MNAALRMLASPFTLVIRDQGAELWDGEGRVLATLPDTPSGAARRRAWGEILQETLPKQAKVQILFAHGKLEIDCQDVPYLNARERRDVAQRVTYTQGTTETKNLALALDVDPFAEGGHQLWIARHPEWEMQDCLGALSFAGASLVFATAWQRAFLAAVPDEQPARIFLALEANIGRLLLFHGRGLLLMRAFRLPEDIDLAELDDAGAELLTEVVVEEASRTLQFVKQKYRGMNFDALNVVGLPDPPVHLIERLGRGLRLAVKNFAPSLPAFLLRGMAREKDHKGGLNLVPMEIQDALKLRFLRGTVWGAATTILILLGAAQVLLMRDEARLKLDLVQAETTRTQRQKLIEEAAQAGRQRLPLIRLQHAEARQKASTEQLERLGVLLFAVPEGITLEKVEIAQISGDALRFHFEVAGSAATRRAFSMGPLAEYVGRLEQHPGMALEPLREISVSDRTPVSGNNLGNNEMAVTRFKLIGVAP